MENAYKTELKKEVGEYLLGSTLGEQKENRNLHGFLIPLPSEHRACLIESIKNELVSGGYFPKDEIHFNQLDACYLANRPYKGDLPNFRYIGTLILLDKYTTNWDKQYSKSLGNAIQIDDFVDIGSNVYLVGKFQLSNPMDEICVEYRPNVFRIELEKLLSDALGIPKDSAKKVAAIYSGNGQLKQQFGAVGTFCSFEKDTGYIRYDRELNVGRKIKSLYNALPEFMRYADNEETPKDFRFSANYDKHIADAYKLRTKILKSHVILSPQSKIYDYFLKTRQKPARGLFSATAFSFEDKIIPTSQNLLAADQVITDNTLREASLKEFGKLKEDIAYYVAQSQQNVGDIPLTPPHVIDRYEWFLKKELDDEELGAYVRPLYISDGYERFNRIFGVSVQNSRKLDSGIGKEQIKKAIDEYNHLLETFNLYVRSDGYSEKSEIYDDDISKKIYHNSIILSITQDGFTEETCMERCGLEQKQFAPRFERLKFRGYILTAQNGIHTTKNAVF